MQQLELAIVPNPDLTNRVVRKTLAYFCCQKNTLYPKLASVSSFAFFFFDVRFPPNSDSSACKYDIVLCRRAGLLR
jgi:hypothetical protein